MTEVDLDHWQGMLDSEVQRLSGGDLVELDHLVIGGLDEPTFSDAEISELLEQDK